MSYLHCGRCGLQIRIQASFMRIEHCPRCLARERDGFAARPERNLGESLGGLASGHGGRPDDPRAGRA